MASASGGVEWNSIVKPILAASYGSFNKNDLPEFIRSVIKSEDDIINHGAEYDTFYSTFALLAADYIAQNAADLLPSQMGGACAAARILGAHMLRSLSGGSRQTSPLSRGQLMDGLRLLCQGGGLEHSDHVTLVAAMKMAKLPPHIRTSVPAEKENAAKTEPKRTRVDPSAALLDHLSAPMYNLASGGESNEATDGATSGQKVKSLFCERNISALQLLGAGDVLVDMCCSLPHIGRYLSRYTDSLETGCLQLPTTLSEAVTVRSSLQALSADVGMVWRALSLPLLEPLTAGRQQRLARLCAACLLAALTVAASGAAVAAPDEAETHAVDVLVRALEVTECVQSVLRASTRSGGHCVQNLQLMAALLLLRGIQAFMCSVSAMGDKPERGKSPVKGKENRINLLKVQQGFGVLAVALTSKALTLLSSLLADVRSESSVLGGEPLPAGGPAALSTPCTAGQRAAALLQAANLPQLLINVAVAAYRRACGLWGSDAAAAAGADTGDVFGLTTGPAFTASFYVDDSSGDEASSDDEDDSILGQWFMQTLYPPGPVTPPASAAASENGTADRPSGGGETSLVPERGEPHGFMSLASMVLRLINSDLLDAECADIRQYVRQGIAEQQVTLLAALIRDVGSGSLSAHASAGSMLTLCQEFSASLTRLTHNLLATRLLSAPLQELLLAQLGLSPWHQEGADWPLTVSPRSLAVLAQVLLLNQESTGPDRLNGRQATALIWSSCLNTLSRRILSTADESADDLNVEHAQLLLFLFHSLELMQKKTVLLQCADVIIKVAPALESAMSPARVLHLARLLVLFEYMVRNLYDAPSFLIDQVRSNLLGRVPGAEKLYIPCKEMDSGAAGGGGGPGAGEPPCFYSLTHSDNGGSDPPRLDGLASSFLLSSPELLDYGAFHAALVSLLRAGGQADLAGRETPLSAAGRANTHYCFSVAWRLCTSLPPSEAFLEQVCAGAESAGAEQQLLSLVWGPRAAHKLYASTIKDGLVKQGLTAHRADALLENVGRRVGDVTRDVELVRRTAGRLDPPQRPRLIDVLTLHAAIAKTQVSLDGQLSRPSSSDSSGRVIEPATAAASQAEDVAGHLLPAVIALIESVSGCISESLLDCLTEEGAEPPSTATRRAYSHLLSVVSPRAAHQFPFADGCAACLPAALRRTLDDWHAAAAADIVFSQNWKSRYGEQPLPSEGYIGSVVAAHVAGLSSVAAPSIGLSLKHLLHCLVRVAEALFTWRSSDERTRAELSRVLLPLVLDLGCESAAAHFDVDSLVGSADSESFQQASCRLVVHHVYAIVRLVSQDADINESVCEECVRCLESMLEVPAGRAALAQAYRDDNTFLMTVLLSAASQRLSFNYGILVLKFCDKLFQAADKSGGELRELCASLDGLASVAPERLQLWLGKLVVSLADRGDESSAGRNERLESQQLLQSLTAYLVREDSAVSEDVARAVLDALTRMGSELFTPSALTAAHGGLVSAMATLASAGSGHGHVALFAACADWLKTCKEYLCQKDVLDKLSEGVTSGRHADVVAFACCLMSHLSNIVLALKMLGDHWRHPGQSGMATPPLEGDQSALEADTEWADELHDDDSDADDSDEDSLNNKLCTFTVTQKEYVPQHWYHCHTCSMLDSVGVCSVCVRVCHKGHDVTYAKNGSFFCDCGAKEDNSCQALVKRSRQQEPLPAGSSGSGATTAAGSCPFGAETMLPSLLRRRHSALSHERTDKGREQSARGRQALSRRLEPFKEAIYSVLHQSDVLSSVLELVRLLLPALAASSRRTAPIGAHRRVAEALATLHTAEKTFINTDTLMVPTLGSQEGAFDNVRMTFAGEQGQTIRQLVSAHMIRRVSMCCLSSPHGKRQHLAVSHEKGKLAVLQLSALLKQGDAAKRKLTLTRLGSAPVPFTVLSIASNPCNEDVLAVCGLKDCHVLTFGSGGAVADHLVLQPQLETGNFIISARWLPGSQTALAIITADFVKLYDLGADVLSPHHFFLLPSGKIRDACVANMQDGSRHVIIMSSTGLIYTVEINEESSAQHGPFYVTNILDLKHPEIKWSNGQICGGGVAIYYSHVLQLLFFSYTQGKSFLAPLTAVGTELDNLTQIQLKPSGSGKPNSQPLCQWSEVIGHPGLVCSVTQSSNNPVILMVKPDSVSVQEIRIVPSKSKITDMVVIRHPAAGGERRTTLIVLCEDGSLRIYMASPERTGFWLSSSLNPTSVMASLRPPRKKKAPKPSRTVGAVQFPPDFFESCQPMSDVEYGGNDVLQVYNTQQVKQRLAMAGMYIASTKPAGFSMEISNSDSSMVMCGLQIQVGSQDPQRAPSCVELLGRSVPLHCSRARWFDVPLTREESLQADRRLTLTFRPTADTSGVTMVDSIKVYGKTKENFDWPEDSDEYMSSPSASGTSLTPGGEGEGGAAAAAVPLTPLDKLVSSALETLEGCVVAAPESDPQRAAALELCTALGQLEAPPAAPVLTQADSLLAALHTSRPAYCSHKDQARLAHAWKMLRRMEATPSARDLDSELYHHLVVTSRNIAICRPANLVKYTAVKPEADKPESGGSSTDFISLMMALFWRLHDAQPENPLTAPVCVPGLTHPETCVYALSDVLYAFLTTEPETAAVLTSVISRLLLSDDLAVSFAAKQGLIRVLRPKQRRRRVFIPSPPRCSTPGAAAASTPPERPSGSGGTGTARAGAAGPPPAAPAESPAAVLVDEAGEPGDDDDDELESDGLDVESLLAQAQGLPPLLDLPPDADDETMVELAIALSLQDQDGTPAALQNLRQQLQGLVGLDALQNLGGQPLQNLLGAAGGAEAGPSGAPAEGHYSDTTASAPASDDEGSTAATDGSTLRTSPAEQAGSGGSESGASVVDSIAGEHMSGRSSTYGDGAHESAAGARSETSSVGVPGHYQPAEADEPETDTSARLHALRLSLTERLLEWLPQVRRVGGVRAIPYLQVLLMLASDLDGSEERDRACLDGLLRALVSQLHTEPAADAPPPHERSTDAEIRLITMRMLSVLMSRPKQVGRHGGDCWAFTATATAAALLQADMMTHCLSTLKALLAFWKTSDKEESGTVVGGKLLRQHPVTSTPDMSPFFLKEYVKRYSSDVFVTFSQLLTEMVLRLPYQVKKVLSAVPGSNVVLFGEEWRQTLCEYMMAPLTPFVRRQVRKLLLYICGNKDTYRQLRDLHALDAHIKAVQTLCGDGSGGSEPDAPLLCLTYDSLIELVEHLKACQEIATTRTVNWQRFCAGRSAVLPFLLRASYQLDEGVAPIILQLLQLAVASPAAPAAGSGSSAKHSAQAAESEGSSLSRQLTRQLMGAGPLPAGTARFVRTFLLESNATAIRWQAHALVLSIYRNAPPADRESLVELLWKLWPLLPSYGRKAAQFVDLLGYMSLKTTEAEDKVSAYMEHAMEMLRTQNQQLANHANGQLYAGLAALVEFDGYYLESEPCLVCNNPEVPYSQLKLSNVKVDSRYTTTTQLVKLVGSHTISRIFLRIGDLKRSKMVRTVNVYYNNRTVQSVVELKNRPAMWHKAKKVSLTSGQTDVKLDFPLPIVACNLMIEYADFYENMQASSETLQCPRCSASVPAHPGVCGNCGENVFQCHKCRAINYDEKDPFLCNACGFCKYAKFEYTLTAKPCCAVDPIESEEDRKKAVTNINGLLERADKIYKKLMSYKPTLEALLAWVSDHGGEVSAAAAAVATDLAAGTAGSHVSRPIQQLAHKYCSDCRRDFDDLSKVIQKVLASRRELLRYDRQAHDGAGTAAASAPAFCQETTSHGRCYGCSSASAECCVTLLRALATNPRLRVTLCSYGLIPQLLEHNLRRGTPQSRDEVCQLLCLLTKDNLAATLELNELISGRVRLALSSGMSSAGVAAAVRHEMALLAAAVRKEDSCWEHRLRCVVRIFIMAGKEHKNPVVIESVTLPCLKILQGVMQPPADAEAAGTSTGGSAAAGGSGTAAAAPAPSTSAAGVPGPSKPAPSSVTAGDQPEVHLSASRWLQQAPQHSFEAWRSRKAKRGREPAKGASRSEVRALFLMEKYGRRWRQRTTQSAISVTFLDTSWLRRVLFSPSSRLARRVAADMVETLASEPARKRQILDMLTSYLSDVSDAGETAAEFIDLYQKLIAANHWKYYLTTKGILGLLAELITKEIDNLNQLEETTLNSDLSQGYALKELTR
ncbi:E3 ubiquitin-protein ligase UBR4-like isoform X2 [Amphibalanus amphitrite]|uniref:E3 ubiquitin-protein ligase UBR4-like isoform X2 n=1 Tax=Amphibalanus amphitrite TaxID=1232801 RepID=UPI001C922933|nr:E3 ubiquitin-protein ligase UBR4-like isoform X2 [Amphibalanus amphitrite]